MTSFEEGIKKDVSILEVMFIRIKRCASGDYHIGSLIRDLECFLNQLTTVNGMWRDDFMNLWSDLEISYAVALSKGLEEDFTDLGKNIVKNALHDLEKMITVKVNELKSSWMNSYKETSRNCRVCGCNQGFEPWGEDGETPTFDICQCCGIQFGREDCSVLEVKEQRKRWLKNESKWFASKGKPEGWSLDDQLKGIPIEYK